MRILLCFWFLFVANFVAVVSGECQRDQQSLLLQMKKSLMFNSSLSKHLAQWSPTTECCGWSGVDCDLAGHVVGLNLCNESIFGGIENATGLFGLRYLQSLNLALNDFNGMQIPSRLGNLTRLTYLNLSASSFRGQIPIEISGMTRLFTLDLSSGYDFDYDYDYNFYYYYYYSTIDANPLKLWKPNLSVLVQNLTRLRELYLDGVDISTSRSEWSQALSSSLPNLQVLSLSGCSLSGPIDSSLASMRSLSKIHLNGNNMSSPVPEFLADYVNLTSLSLRYCGLYGKFPEKIFQVRTLETLDFSENELLEGFLPYHFPKNASLRTLKIERTMFSGALPDSIDNLRNLSMLELHGNNFTGPIPSSMSNLTRLVHLDLSQNHFSGPIPSFHFSKSLNHLDLSDNSLTGAISSVGWEEFLNLDYVDLSYNSLIGRIPPSLFALPSLRRLNLYSNQFRGDVPKFSNASSLVLDTLYLGSNKLEGQIPMSVFQLKNLDTLDLSFNNLDGTVQLDWFGNLPDLEELDLSYNRLTVNATSSFPPVKTLYLTLASCNLRNFPNLENTTIVGLDLSNNQIHGKIPNWIWKKDFWSLNLSHNLLVGLQEPYPNTSFASLELQFNLLQGKLPLFSSLYYIDYSNNLFSSIPADIGNHTLPSFFSLSNNKLKGVIPTSLCNQHFSILDLSGNNLSGRIPRCLIRNISGVLNLGRNNLSGLISDNFPVDCGLRSLNLNGNHLEGILPKSLANCGKLEVVDVSNNQIFDQFPCWLKNASSLRALVLRSNRFYGKVGCLEINSSWPLLQIIDLSFNNFSGRLPQKSLTNWKPMTMDHEDKAQSELTSFYSAGYKVRKYDDKIVVTIKDLQMELVRILNIFTMMDLSCNYFEGSIPEEIGVLRSLHVLNLSHNTLTGQIPSSVGNLKELESFDLSFNKLSGVIPPAFASLNFLSVLNLSYNHLVGKIPLSTQLQSFPPNSFIGNQGLCGLPLTVNCTNPPIKSPTTVSGKEIDWRFVSMAIGFAIGFGVIVTPLMFSKKVNKWYDDRIDKFLK